MKKILSVFCLFLFSMMVFAQQAENDVSGAPDQRWSPEKANQWYADQPWLVGCDFIPSTAVNQLEMWQADTFDPDTIDKELSWAASIGMNSARVYLHDLLWTQDSDGFIERIDLFLDICKKHGIKPMFVLFDSCWNPHPKLGKQPDPKPHTHNSGWVQSPHIDIIKNPERIDTLRPYVKGILERFKNDHRILLWDLYNEPGNKQEDDESLVLLKKAFTWARQVNPSQPLTAGLWEGDWQKDKLSELNKYMLDNSDVITFHAYHGLDKTKIKFENLKPYGRPLLCTEYMARTAGSTFANHLPYFKEHKIGAYNWGFVAGKTQTQYPWDSWDKTYTKEPKVWFHDIFRPDGTPYDKAETDLIKKLTQSNVAPAAKIQPKTNPVVKIATNKGDILVELDADKAPISVANFLEYTKSGFYNGTIFHRVIKNFMIQGGGMTPDMKRKKTKPPIKNESYNKVRNKRGTIAMARTNAPNSATSQFFINHVDNKALDFDGPYSPGYAVFGKVFKGMDVVDAIAVTPTRKPGDVPIEQVVIESVTLVE